MSSFLMCILDYLRRQADDLQKASLAQLAGHGPEDACSARVLVFLVEQHQSVAIEADIAPVVAPGRFFEPHDHALDNFTWLDIAAGDCLLDTGDDDITEAGIASPAAAQHLDAHALLGAGVVRNVE